MPRISCISPKTSATPLLGSSAFLSSGNAARTDLFASMSGSASLRSTVPLGSANEKKVLFATSRSFTDARAPAIALWRARRFAPGSASSSVVSFAAPAGRPFRSWWMSSFTTGTSLSTTSAAFFSEALPSSLQAVARAATSARESAPALVARIEVRIIPHRLSMRSGVPSTGPSLLKWSRA
jgi:hypothetical protein